MPRRTCLQRSTGFNPPPAVRPGETAIAGPSYAGADSFNPPPAVRPGETSDHDFDAELLDVSIRPRR